MLMQKKVYLIYLLNLIEEFGCDVKFLDADNFEENSMASPRDFQIKVI